MSWIDKILPSIVKSESKDRKVNVPEGLWKKCVKCEAVLYRPDLERNLDVCPKCDHHMRIGARRRIDVFLDLDGREEVCTEVEPVDRLKFKDLKKYKDRLSQAQKATGEKDALIAFEGQVLGLPLVVVAFEFNFHGEERHSAGVLFRLRWSAHAGSAVVADADGKNQCCR